MTIAFAANERPTIVNALQGTHVVDTDEADTYRRLQRPLIEALCALRPKAHFEEKSGWLTTDWVQPNGAAPGRRASSGQHPACLAGHPRIR